MTDGARSRWLPGPVLEAMAFYREHPLLLLVALTLAAGLGAAVLVDGGVDLGEAVGVVAAGALVGLVYAAFRSVKDDG